MHTVKITRVKFKPVAVNVVAIFFTMPLFSPHLRRKHTQTLSIIYLEKNIS